MKLLCWRCGVLTLSALVALSGAASAAEKGKNLASFGSLEQASPEAVKAEAQAWAKKALAGDRLKKFDAIWKAEDRPLGDTQRRRIRRHQRSPGQRRSVLA